MGLFARKGMAVETMRRITRDLSRVIDKLAKPMGAGERYSILREVKALAIALSLNAEENMLAAKREDPEAIAKIRKKEWYNPHC